MDFDTLKEVLAALERHGVRYVIFGAAALNVHGLARFTEPTPGPIESEVLARIRLDIGIQEQRCFAVEGVEVTPGSLPGILEREVVGFLQVAVVAGKHKVVPPICQPIVAGIDPGAPLALANRALRAKVIDPKGRSRRRPRLAVAALVLLESREKFLDSVGSVNVVDESELQLTRAIRSRIPYVSFAVLLGRRVSTMQKHLWSCVRFVQTNHFRSPCRA